MSGGGPIARDPAGPTALGAALGHDLGLGTLNPERTSSGAGAPGPDLAIHDLLGAIHWGSEPSDADQASDHDSDGSSGGNDGDTSSDDGSEGDEPSAREHSARRGEGRCRAVGESFSVRS